MFELYTIGIFITSVAGCMWGVFRANDTLHPLVYLMPMAGFIYVYMPLSLYRSGEMTEYFSMSHIAYTQGFTLTCVIGLIVGVIWGSKSLRRDPNRVDRTEARLTPTARRRLTVMGLFFGAASFLAYLYRISIVGGFYEAYNDPKGGGWAASGYIRELDLLIVPAITMIYMGYSNTRMPMRMRLALAFLSTPLLIHGILSARRGPTFLGFAALIGGWYLVKNNRPSLSQLFIGGGTIGLLLLVLVTFRGEIFLGSAFLSGDSRSSTEIVQKSLEYSTKGSFGNEYMMALYIIRNAQENDTHYWGKRYLTQIFIRPIPSAIWPSKYEDVNMEVLKVSAGLLGTTNLEEEHPMIPPGSAPGFAGSAYVEFAWGAPLFLVFLGWLYGTVWRKQLIHGGLWRITYVALLATSVFFVAQAFLAVLFRLLVMVIPTFIVWKLNFPNPRHSPQQNTIA